MSEAADSMPVRLIPNGVGAGLFRPADAATEHGGPLRLLFVVRFQDQKNLSWLLRQLSRTQTPWYTLLW